MTPRLNSLLNTAWKPNLCPVSIARLSIRSYLVPFTTHVSASILEVICDIRSLTWYISMSMVFATVVKASSISTLSPTSSPTYSPSPSETYFPHIVGFTENPAGRGTLNLLWSCLSILFLCTWTVQHPPVGSTGSFSRIFSAGVSLLAPEIYMAAAISEWYEARQLVRELKRLGYNQWTMTHSFFTTIRGFQVENPEDSQYPGENLPLGTGQLLWMARSRCVSFPDVAKKALLDRSKADHLAKLIAVMQAGWLVIQCIARLVQGLPLSHLEVTTVASVVCTVVTYCAWWNKPVNVGLPIMIRIDSLSAEDREDLLCAELRVAQNGILRWYFSSLLVGGLIFGGIHFSASFYLTFPTHKERLVWLVFSIFTICPGFGIGNYYYKVEVKSNLRLYQVRAWAARLEIVVFPLLLIEYGVTRVSLIIEAILCLRAVPSGVYQTVRWVQFLPKFS